MTTDEAMRDMAKGMDAASAAMRQLGVTASEAAAAFRRMQPILAQAYRELMLLDPSDPVRFRLWVVEQPRWQRPLMRLAYWIERLVLQ